MVNPSRDALRELYNIDAEYCNIDASVDELPNGEPADFAFGCEIYKSKDGTYYAVVTSKYTLAADETIIASLERYATYYSEEYDIDADYVPHEPPKPVRGFRVYRLDPHTKDGQPVPVTKY